jgi:hypothetical protein
MNLTTGKDGASEFRVPPEKSAGECGDCIRFDLSPHPPGAQFSLGKTKLMHRAKEASDFFTASRHYGCAFYQTSLH